MWFCLGCCPACLQPPKVQDPGQSSNPQCLVLCECAAHTRDSKGGLVGYEAAVLYNCAPALLGCSGRSGTTSSCYSVNFIKFVLWVTVPPSGRVWCLVDFAAEGKIRFFHQDWKPDLKGMFTLCPQQTELLSWGQSAISGTL